MSPVPSADRIVRTTDGPVQGMPSRVAGVTVFKGLPFAAPTGGRNRWRPPQPVQPWRDVRVADRFGAACPQVHPDLEVVTSEDCLSLNVWVPDGPAERPRPVYVWIYGGRFTFGTGADPLYDGGGLASRGVIVVTFDYRTGVFGFLATPELAAEADGIGSGNLGLLDQVAALRWVRANIAAFGGDPDRVTIGGQSAGAASVLHLLSSPFATGLVHGAVVESGALHPRDPGLAYLASAYRTRDQAEQEGLVYAAEHGASSTAELRALPVAALMQGNQADEPGGGHRPPLFRPVLDGVVIPRTYEETLVLGSQADVPVLTGTNLDEDGASPRPDLSLEEFRRRAQEKYGALTEEFFRLYPARDSGSAGEQSNAAARDQSRVSTWMWASLRRQRSASPVFTYFWTRAAPGPGAEVRGAFHGAEISYFLDSLDTIDRPWSGSDRRIRDVSAAYLANFIATGDPNGPDVPHWPAASDASPTTMELGQAFGPIRIADSARMEFQRRFLAGQDTAR